MDNTAIFKRIMVYMKSYRYFIGMITMTVMFAMTSIFQALAVKYLIDAAQDKDLDKLILISWGLIVLIISMVTLIPFFRFMYNGRAVLGKGIMKLDAFHKIILLPVTYFENTHSGFIMTNITNDIEISASLFTWRLHLAIAPFIYGSFSMVPMFALNWKLSLVCIAVNISLASINLLYTKPVRKISEKIQENLDAFNESLFNMLSGFSVMKLFQIENKIGGYFINACDEFSINSLKRVKLSALIDSLNQFIGNASSIGMVLAGVWLADRNVASVGTILTLISLQNSVNNAFLEAGNRIPQLQEAFVSGKRVFNAMDTEPEPESYTTAYETAENVALSMNSLSFSYDNETEILKNINLTVKHGQTAALVGPSGCGKSTILKLFLGFYPPNDGNIIINEKSLGQHTLSQIRELISYVPQDAYMFWGTIEDNIRYGKADASDEEVINAAKAAYAHEFIIDQPDGYKTMVGENGAALSGGQRQRIAIARAFLKNSPIILLDEATSSLDSESEKYVHEAMDKLMENKTILLIAHRLSTVEKADIIYVLKDGQIAEQGNHEELIQKNGLYSELSNNHV